jgi:hypothetical protein
MQDLNPQQKKIYELINGREEVKYYIGTAQKINIDVKNILTLVRGTSELSPFSPTRASFWLFGSTRKASCNRYNFMMKETHCK